MLIRLLALLNSLMLNVTDVPPSDRELLLTYSSVRAW